MNCFTAEAVSLIFWQNKKFFQPVCFSTPTAQMCKTHNGFIVLDKINNMSVFCPVGQIFLCFFSALVVVAVCLPKALNQRKDLIFLICILL